MRHRAALIISVLLLAGFSFAQTTQLATRAQVLKMLEAMQAEKTVHGVMESMQAQAMESMESQMRKVAPNAPPEMRTEMSAAMQDMMKEMEPIMNDVMHDMVPIYQKHLTRKEVLAITAFYLSPEGRSFLNKMPLIMNDSMTTMTKSMQAKMQPIIDKMSDRMEEIADKYAPQTHDHAHPQQSTSPAAAPNTKPVSPATK